MLSVEEFRRHLLVKGLLRYRRQEELDCLSMRFEERD